MKKPDTKEYAGEVFVCRKEDVIEPWSPFAGLRDKNIELNLNVIDCGHSTNKFPVCDVCRKKLLLKKI